MPIGGAELSKVRVQLPETIGELPKNSGEMSKMTDELSELSSRLSEISIRGDKSIYKHRHNSLSGNFQCFDVIKV